MKRAKRLDRSASALQERRQGNKFLRCIAATALVRRIKNVHEASSHTERSGRGCPGA